MLAVNNHGYALRYASDTLQNDKDVVSAAVNNHSIAFIFASNALRNDKQIVLMAITNNPDLLMYASDTLKNDREVVYTAISKAGRAFEYVSDHLKNDKELAILAINNSHYDTWEDCHYENDEFRQLTFDFIHETLKYDIDVVMAAVKNNGFVLYYISNKFIRSNYKIVVYAINTSGLDVLSHVPPDNCTVEKIKHKYYHVNYGEYSEIYETSKHTCYNLYDYLKENIQIHESFLVFIYGILIPRSQSILHKYDYFHSIHFLKLIVDFTGMIYGNDYRIYKSVFDQVHLYLNK
jgi:hypothetical protein